MVCSGRKDENTSWAEYSSIHDQDKSTCQRSDGLVRQIILFALVCAFAVQSRAETVVSFDVGASGPFSLSPTESAGIVNVGNWNNLTGSGSSDSFSNGVDSNGVATTIDLNISGADGVNWQGNSFHNLSENNASLVQDTAYVNNQDSNTSGGALDSFTVSFSDIGFDSYDVYLYTGAGQSDWGGSVSDGTTTYYVKGHDLSPGFTRATDPVEGATVTENYNNAGTADYIVYEGLTGESQAFEFTAFNQQIYFSAAQIVGVNFSASAATAVPEPSMGMILMAIGGYGFATRRRRRDSSAK